MTQPVDDMPETPEAATPWLTPVILAAFTAYLAAAGPAVVTGTVVNPSALWQFQDLWTRQVDRFYPYLMRMARNGWIRTTRDLGVLTPWDPRDPDLADILTQSRNLLVRIPDEIYREIIRIMARAQDRGETQAQIAARVSNYLNITGSENWPNRSNVIARTELNRFDQSGGLAAMRSTERRSNRTILKQWKDRDDNRVRSVHAQVDNQMRRLGEPFHVGRSMLQQPIDPRGFPEDVINCRCDLKYRWK